jgi:heptosyltransferase I
VNTPSRILLVRLGALGDIVHALPVLAACRRTWPSARIDWLVDVRYGGVLDIVRGVDEVVRIDPWGRWQRLPGVVRELRRRRYDVTLDLQGLVKSAALARASGAARVIGFERRAVREAPAAFFYSERVRVDDRAHVTRKNLRLAEAIGADATRLEFPFEIPARRVGPAGKYAVLNPGGGWPNKQWPATRFAAVARWLLDAQGLGSLVLWGPREAALAEAIVAEAGGAATLAPRTSLGDLLALARDAEVFLSGDTGPLHLAAAAGTPLVALFGPTSPARNGPFAADDLSASRFDACACHHRRRCRRPTPCIEEIAVAEVQELLERRLARAALAARR